MRLIRRIFLGQGIWRCDRTETGLNTLLCDSVSSPDAEKFINDLTKRKPTMPRRFGHSDKHEVFRRMFNSTFVK